MNEHQSHQSVTLKELLKFILSNIVTVTLRKSLSEKKHKFADGIFSMISSQKCNQNMLFDFGNLILKLNCQNQ